jgi:hypothetical protein
MKEKGNSTVSPPNNPTNRPKPDLVQAKPCHVLVHASVVLAATLRWIPVDRMQSRGARQQTRLVFRLKIVSSIHWQRTHRTPCLVNKTNCIDDLEQIQKFLQGVSNMTIEEKVSITISIEKHYRDRLRTMAAEQNLQDPDRMTSASSIVREIICEFLDGLKGETTEVIELDVVKREGD